MYIPYYDLQQISASFEPQLSQRIQAVVAGGRYLHGEELAAFERDFARYVGARHCIGVANGLDALTLVLMAWKRLKGWGDGDEVCVPALTFVATAEAVNRAGLRPVFCDVGKDFVMTAQTLLPHLTPQTRAVIPVHLYGHPCPMDGINALASSRGIMVLEDAAQAHGASTGGHKTGSMGHAAAFSMYPGKNLGALGDGGCVTTDDEELAQTVRMFANYGAQQKYVHRVQGINSRLSEIQAAALNVKLPRLDADNARRRNVARFYNTHIVNPLVRLPYEGRVAQSVFHIYPVLCRRRDKLQQYLQERGIETLIHYPIPVHKQEAYAAYNAQSYPVAELVAREVLSLPITQFLTEEELHYIVSAVNAFR